MAEEPQNRLDAAIERFREVVKSRVEEPLRQLQEAIDFQRQKGPLDEELIAQEIEQIAHRERMEHRRRFSAGEELENLIARIMSNPPWRKP
jgi:hypothetical protein